MSFYAVPVVSGQAHVSLRFNRAAAMQSDEQRKDAAARRKFNRALERLPDDHEGKQRWQALPNRQLRNQFQQAWQKDPSWNFVAMFKTEIAEHAQEDRVEYAWFTEAEMKQKYGKQAKKVQKLKEEQSLYKVDDGDQQPRWQCKSKDMETETTKHVQKKGLTFSSESDFKRPRTAPQPATQAAIQDAPRDSDPAPAAASLVRDALEKLKPRSRKKVQRLTVDLPPHVVETIQLLPQESLATLATFVEHLRTATS